MDEGEGRLLLCGCQKSRFLMPQPRTWKSVDRFK